MKKQTLSIALIMALLTTFQGCAVIGGIFKTGMGVGVFVVLAIIAVVIFLIFRNRKGK